MHSALATPDLHWLRCEQSFIQHSSVIGSRPEWETLTCSSQKRARALSMFGQKEVVSVLGLLGTGPPSQLLGPLSPLWVNAQAVCSFRKPLQLPAGSGKQHLY